MNNRVFCKVAGVFVEMMINTEICIGVGTEIDSDIPSKYDMKLLDPTQARLLASYLLDAATRIELVIKETKTAMNNQETVNAVVYTNLQRGLEEGTLDVLDITSMNLALLLDSDLLVTKGWEKIKAWASENGKPHEMTVTALRTVLPKIIESLL